MAIKRNEDKFVKMLRNYSEAITGDNAKPYDFIPSDVDDIEANAADTERRSGDNDRDEAVATCEDFLANLQGEVSQLIAKRVSGFIAGDSQLGDAMDIVLEFQGDGSNNNDMNVYCFANIVYDAMRDESIDPDYDYSREDGKR